MKWRFGRVMKMIDTIKTIKGLHEASRIIEVYIPERFRGYSVKAIQDAIAMLKAQEPKPPVKDGNGCLICGNQDLGCGVVGKYDVETGKVTERYDNYCAYCGTKVKWDD